MNGITNFRSNAEALEQFIAAVVHLMIFKYLQLSGVRGVQEGVGVGIFQVHHLARTKASQNIDKRDSRSIDDDGLVETDDQQSLEMAAGKCEWPVSSSK